MAFTQRLHCSSSWGVPYKDPRYKPRKGTTMEPNYGQSFRGLQQGVVGKQRVTYEATAACFALYWR